MLDKTSKKFLRFLDTCPDNTFVYGNGFPEELGKEDDIFATIRYLEKLGYVEIITNQRQRHIGVRLSHIAINRKEFSRNKFLRFILNSFIIPLIVAILTSIITVSILN